MFPATNCGDRTCGSHIFHRFPNLPSRLSTHLLSRTIVEQDHRATKRIVRPMLGFKSFRCAAILIAGIETMHMIRKGQFDCPEGQASSAANQFYSLIN